MTPLEYLSPVWPVLVLIALGWWLTRPTPRKKRSSRWVDNTGQSVGEMGHRQTAHEHQPTRAEAARIRRSEIERGAEVQELANLIRFGEKVRSSEYMEVAPYHYQEWTAKEYQQALADEKEFLNTMPKTRYDPKTGRPLQQ